MCRKWETVGALGGHNPEKLWGRQLPAKQWKYTNIKWDRQKDIQLTVVTLLWINQLALESKYTACEE